jgi:hypothetical protein
MGIARRGSCGRMVIFGQKQAGLAMPWRLRLLGEVRLHARGVQRVMTGLRRELAEKSGFALRHIAIAGQGQSGQPVLSYSWAVVGRGRVEAVDAWALREEGRVEGWLFSARNRPAWRWRCHGGSVYLERSFPTLEGCSGSCQAYDENWPRRAASRSAWQTHGHRGTGAVGAAGASTPLSCGR